MEILILVLVVVIAALIWLRSRELFPAEIENMTKRVQALQQRADTQFLATPGDPRLKAGWEYMVALKKPGQEDFTFTYFTSAGISHTKSGMSEDAVFALRDEGWHINAQRLTREGMSWQLERPTVKHAAMDTITE